MLKRQEDQAFSLCVRFINFVPGKGHPEQFGPDSCIYVLITKESTSPMFISDFVDVAKFDSTVKCFVDEGKIPLGNQTLYFNVKLSDLKAKNIFFIKIKHIKNQKQTELTYFKFFVSKYIEVMQLEGRRYTQQNFFQKTGARIEAQVFIEKNRRALQTLMMQTNDEKLKNKTLEIKKKREEKKFTQKSGGGSTIEMMYQESKQEKTIIKTKQRAELKKLAQGYKRRKENSSEPEYDQHDQIDPESYVMKTREELLKQREKRNQNLAVSRGVGNGHDILNISKISEVINSENGSDFDKGNSFQNFSREKDIICASEYRKQSGQQDFDQILNHSQHGKSAIIMMTQEDNLPNNSCISPGYTKKSKDQILENQQMDDDDFCSGVSRSFIGAIDLESENSNITRSSQNSARSELEQLLEKRNKLFWFLLAVITIFMLYYLMVPNCRAKRSKFSGRMSKRGKK